MDMGSGEHRSVNGSPQPFRCGSFPHLTPPPSPPLDPGMQALYEHYGFGVKDIGRLFIVGFGSSRVFGTIVGSMADK